MKSQLFIPNKVDPLDSDDSSIGGDVIYVENLPLGLSDLESLEDTTDDSDGNHSSSESNDDGEFESDSLTESDPEDENIEADDGESTPTEPKVVDDGCVEIKKTSEQNNGASTSKDDSKDSDLESECSDLESECSEEATATMEDIFEVGPNQEAIKNRPPDLKSDTCILDLCFHPENDLLAAATIDGDVIIYNYNLEEVNEVRRFSHHKRSCRQLSYNHSGKVLYTVSKDKSLAVVDVESGVVKKHVRKAHDCPIYSFFEVDENRCATGDDDGTVKLWDMRQAKPIFDFSCGEETITSLLACEDAKYLSATVGDGSLTGFNLRRNRIEAQSEMFESEFTSQSLVKSQTRLVIGTESGVLHLFRWGDFGYKVDALGGHPSMIHCQGSLTEKLIITGCEDGNIRAIHLYPHRFLGIVGQHKNYGVENFSVSHDGSYLASCSKEEVSFWNIEYLLKMKTPKEKKVRNKNVAMARNMQSSRQRDKQHFFRDFPNKVESQDDEMGPVTGIGYRSD